MSFHEIFRTHQDLDTDLPLLANASREKIIKEVNTIKRWDLIIAGGGIHGAAFARLASLNGLKVLLLEAQDYASGTSSRSSKMAHGGLRYLELLDFKQVNEGIKAREELYQIAPYLVKPHEFFIPLKISQTFLKFKLSLGLWFYDRLLRNRNHRHAWKDRKNLNLELAEDYRGGFSYYDGLMNDARLVLANIYSARQEGALCLNYAKLESFSQSKDGNVNVSWLDVLSGEKHEAKCGVLVNTSGPWVPTLGRITKGELSSRVVYSQGTHLLFDHSWDGPALFLPLAEKGRYYFIWPHTAGTLVGTTERNITEVVADPQPTAEEIDEVLQRLVRDVPQFGLTRDKLVYAYAGVRVLPLRSKVETSARISRRHLWHYSNGMLSLLGGKLTTANWTAFEGLEKVFALAGLRQVPSPCLGRALSGAGNLQEEGEEFINLCQLRNVPPAVAQSCLRRLGSNVKYLVKLDPNFELIGGIILKADILYSLKFDQAETIDDLLRRRLEIEYRPIEALRILNELCDYLKQIKPEANWDLQAERYKARIETLLKLLSARS